MLICPQCQFENPNTNKFCQHCGTSLTHLVCPKCGENVALSEKECQNCGTVTGKVWSAIIWRELGNESAAATEPNEAGTPQSEKYLDKQRRYQLLETLPLRQNTAATTEVQVRVLDCQPFQPSPLEVSVKEGMAIEIPEIARAYLALQSQFYHQLPTIHDAWQQDKQVVIIADRCDWPKLMDMWQDDKTTSLQILHWLYEMTKLWAVLEPWHCRQSLLELSNLRVDEDGVLGLQRLYAEIEAGPSLTVQDLGLVWQSFFQESQRTQLGSLIELMSDLKAGNIQTIDELRSRLEEISNKVEANVTSTSAQLPALIAVEPESAAAPEFLKLDQPQSSLSKSDDMPTLVLPMQLYSLEDAGRTDVGRQRDHNEDFFGIETVINKLEFPNGQAVHAHGLYILCDGMGGHAGGRWLVPWQ